MRVPIQLNNIKRSVVAASILGLGAAIVNSLSSAAYPTSLLQPGNLLIFLSAGALGSSGALISCAVALLPKFVSAATQVDALRLVILCTLIGYGSEQYKNIPSFLISLSCWIFIFGPIFTWFAPATSLSPDLTHWGVMFYGLQEVLLTMISGALLLNPRLWTLITNKPRLTSLSSFLIHTITIISTLSLLSALYLSSAATGIVLGTSADLLVLVATAIIVPAYFADRIAARVMREAPNFMANGLRTQTSAATFSGLSSDYWRRQVNNASSAGEVLDEEQRRLVQELGHDLSVTKKAILAVNRNGTISFVNRKFRALFAVTLNEVVGKSISQLGLPSEVSTHILKLVDDTFQSGPKCTELKLNELPNQLRFYEISSLRSDAYQASAISDGPDSIIVTVRDITERRTVEAHLLQAQKVQSLGETIAGLAHAFNNSLTAITGYASFARQSTSLSDIRENLDMIMGSATSAGSMVRTLLDFSDGKPTPMKEHDLAQLIEGRLDLLRKMAGDAYEISFKAPKTKLGAICDEYLITQALNNLLLNAKEAYQGRSGQIQITLDTEEMDEEVAFLHPGASAGKYARLRVKDFGQGMSRETLAHAFDPLFTTKSFEGHTGLGLSIIFAIVKAHGGFMSAESRPEKGTVISIYLPLTELAAAASTSQISEEQEPTYSSSMPADLMGNKQDILVVEDEPVVRDLICKMLQSLGYEVQSCSNGQEALAANQSKKFDLVLVDMVMPKMSGLELISTLKEIGNTPKTLIMTGYGLTNQNSEFGSDLIPKPFDMDTLGRAVRDVLSKDCTAVKKPESAKAISSSLSDLN